VLFLNKNQGNKKPHREDWFGEGIINLSPITPGKSSCSDFVLRAVFSKMIIDCASKLSCKKNVCILIHP
jgi:hypothetical protein